MASTLIPLEFLFIPYTSTDNLVAIAKEASKRIVSDLLQTAAHGGATDDEFTDEVGGVVDYEIGEPTSPSVVRGAPIGDETF